MKKYDELISQARDFRAGCNAEYLETQLADAVEELQQRITDIESWTSWAWEEYRVLGSRTGTVSGNLLDKILKGADYDKPWDHTHEWGEWDYTFNPGGTRRCKTCGEKNYD